MAQSEIIKLLQSYVLLLNEAGLKIQKAFLYGSFARNEARPDSDIDVMLVSENFDHFDIKAKAKAWQLTRKVDLRIEPFTIGIKRFFSDDDSALVDQVKKEGIEIAF
jgi:predicted nucleotidyltransferase